MHDTLHLLDMEEDYKNLLYDKYVHNLTPTQIMKKRYLAKSTVYNKIKIAENQFNMLVNNESNRLPPELRKVLESYKKIL